MSSRHTPALVVLGLAQTAFGCAAPAPAVPAHACLSADDPACQARAEEVVDAEPAADAYTGAQVGAESVDPRWQPRELGAVSAAATRPPRHGRHDLRLHQARLDDAVRLLAREGDFNVVIHGDLPQTVSVELRDVDAYEALLVLAESHGVAVHYQDGIVTVKSRERAAADAAPPP